ncbi:Sorting and assembly machinery component 50-like protein [Nymphaea thermarum]|nr:Sorting and assembly machinery component 50-like protein [Nymphaea thermarum]
METRKGEADAQQEEEKPAKVEDNGGAVTEENEEGEEEGEEEEEDERVEGINVVAGPEAEKAKLERAFRRLSTEKVGIRVHDILIKGNTKTKDSLIEAELEAMRDAKTVQELIRAASIANARLGSWEIFESVSITLDSGPPELPGTANVIVDVRELKNPLTGDIGVFSKPEAQSWSVEGSVKLKNLFGYGDIWDSSGSYGWNQTTEISSGVSLPRLGRLSTPLTARVSLLSQDWLKFSSYKEGLLGFSVGLFSTRRHDLLYNLTWRTLTDPSHMSSKSIRRQLGHSLVSSVRYMYKLDKRDSQLRPTSGYAVSSVFHIGGLDPDSRSLRFVRQVKNFIHLFPFKYRLQILALVHSVHFPPHFGPT